MWKRIAAMVGLAGAAASATATWSIIIVDTRTGEVAVASATCLTGFDLQANTPVLLTGIGAATAQSSVDANGANRTYIRDRLLAGETPEAILAGLAARDTAHQTRQYGIVDVRGGAGTFSGSRAGLWAGGRTGRVGDLVYAVQGNVLTGSPVVDEAARAIEETPGDVAAKLMASMEAARAMGGDGRCSCNPNDADGCGSPPPSFEKSAHIAYMLIARAGDAWDCRAVYRTQAGASDLVIVDGNGDGRPDVHLGAVQTPAGLLGLRQRMTREIAFEDAVISAAGGPVRGLAAGDVNGDGVADLVGTNIDSDRIVVLRGVNGGGYVVAGTAAVMDQPGPIVLADFNGDGRVDAGVASVSAPSVSVVFGDGAGGFGGERRIPVPGATTGFGAGDVDGDGDADLVTAHLAGTRSVWVHRNNGAGVLASEQVRSGFDFAPSVLTVRDVSGDGRPDIVYGGGAAIVVVTDLANAASDRRIVVPTAVSALDVADADGDGVADLLVASGSTLRVYRGLGGGSFGSPVAWPMGFTASRIAAKDLDLDGDVDVAYTTSGGTAVVMTNLAGPRAMPEFENAGCASGAGFMEFNIANQQAGDLDPVLQLREMYDAWREGLERDADAVRSETVWSPRGDAPADGRTVRTLRVRLLDWRGEAVSANHRLEVRRSSGVDIAVTGQRALGDGVFEVEVQAGRACGRAELEVRAIGPGWAIPLMPSPTLDLGSPADANDDGFVDFFDYDRFVGWAETGDERADLDGSGAVDADDLAAFVRAFEAGC